MLMQFFKGIPVCRTISVSERYFCITQSQNVMFPIRNNHSNVMILNFRGFISQTRKHNLKLILFESIKEIKIIPFNFACIFLFTDVKYIKFVSWFCPRHFRVYETKIAPIGDCKNRSRDLQRLSCRQFHQRFYVQIFCTNVVSADFLVLFWLWRKNQTKNTRVKRWWNWHLINAL